MKEVKKVWERSPSELAEVPASQIASAIFAVLDRIEDREELLVALECLASDVRHLLDVDMRVSRAKPRKL